MSAKSSGPGNNTKRNTRKSSRSRRSNKSTHGKNGPVRNLDSATNEPVTATEAMAAVQKYRTFEQKIQREMFEKMTEIFQKAYAETMANIMENLEDMTPPAREVK